MTRRSSSKRSKQRKTKQANTLIICHGETEEKLAKHIRSQLKIPIEIKKRDSNIQISSINQVLKGNDFKSATGLIDNFQNISAEDNRLSTSVRLFPIMDLDDATFEEIKAYKTGAMFHKHWLARHLVPIYNTDNIEDVFEEIGLEFTRNHNEKGKLYELVFPINHDGKTNLSHIKGLRELFAKSSRTNLEVLFDHCISEYEMRHSRD